MGENARFENGHVRVETLAFFRRHPRAHKNKIGTPPHPKNPKYPPLKGGLFWAWRFSCRKNADFSRRP